MVHEYIIKVDEDKKDIMGNCPLVDKPMELVRCKDCRFAHLTYDGSCKQCEKAIDDDDNMLTLYLPGDFFCGYGERKGGKQDE